MTEKPTSPGSGSEAPLPTNGTQSRTGFSAPPPMPTTGSVPPPVPMTGAASRRATQRNAMERFTSRGRSTAHKNSTVAQDGRVPLPAGTRVGDYTISSKIGIGGFGITYFATHTEEGTPVAIKEHIPEGLAVREPNSTFVIHTSPEREARFKATLEEFQEEVTVLMGLSHPGIIPILSAFTANGTAYYVMPFQEGEPMSFVEQATLDQEQQAQTARHNKRLLLSLLSTLDYLRMHQIVHRDIKTDNILVTREGGTVLLDFGSARQLQPGKVFTNVYTPDFSAPEQSRARTDEEMSQTIGPWTDLYALGVCFYYLVTHLFPPRSDLRMLATQDPYTPLAGRADLEKLYGAAFLRAIDRALELKIRDRWQSAAAWRMAIEEGVVSVAPKVTLRMRMVAGTLALVILLLVGISLWMLDEKARAERATDNSLRFVEHMLNDFNQELADIPGSTRLQRIFGEHLNAYLSGIEMSGAAGARDEKMLRSLTASWRNYGIVCLQQGKLEEADDAYRRAAEYLRQQLASDEGATSYIYELANVLLNRVEIARSRNQTEQVRTYLNEATGLLRGLCAQEPNNPDFIYSWGQALAETARLARYEGKMEQYRDSLAEMLEIYRRLEDQYPDHEKAREGLGYALQNNAEYAMQSDNFAAASAYLDEAKGLFSSLAAQFPYRLSFQKGLALTYYALGNMYSRMSETTLSEGESKTYDEQALEALRKHIELVNHLESQDENKAEYPYMACRALNTMVEILLRTGQPNMAEAYSNTIMRKVSKLRANAVDNMDYAVLEAKGWRGLAIAHSRAPRYAMKAAEEFAKYRQSVEEILQHSRNNSSIRFLYTDALIESAAHALTTGQVVQARRWLQQAETILERLTRNYPESAEYAERLRSVKEKLAGMPTGGPARES